MRILPLILIFLLLNTPIAFAQEAPPEVGNSPVLEAKGAPFKEGWNYFRLGFNDCSAKNVLEELQADGGAALKVNELYTKETFSWDPYSYPNPKSSEKKIGSNQTLAFSSNQNFYLEMDQKVCQFPDPKRQEQIKEVREGRSGQASFVEKVRDLPADLWTKLTDLLNREETSLPAEKSLGTPNFENLTIGGKTVVNDLGITGKVSAGTLSIDGLLSTIGSLTDLKFELPGGEVVIDKNGNLKTNGTLTVGKLQLNQEDESRKSAGSVIIKAGQTQISVNSSLLTSNSLIFATPDKPVAVGAKRIDTTTVSITIKEPLNEDLNVNWWIII